MESKRYPERARRKHKHGVEVKLLRLGSLNQMYLLPIANKAHRTDVAKPVHFTESNALHNPLMDRMKSDSEVGLQRWQWKPSLGSFSPQNVSAA